MSTTPDERELALELALDSYQYRATYCFERGAYVAKCREWPLLEHVGESPMAAAYGLRKLIRIASVVRHKEVLEEA